MGLPFFQGKADFGDVYPLPRVWCTAPIRVAEQGDVLISVRAPVGATNVASERCCIGRGLVAIRGSDQMNSTFLRYYLLHIEKDIQSLGSGSTFSSITTKQLESISVPAITQSAQSEAIKFLDEGFSIYRRAKSLVKDKIEDARSLRSSIIFRPFASITPLSTRPTEPCSIGIWKRLSDLARLESGHTPSRRVEAWWGGDIPWIALPDIRALDGKKAMTTLRNTNPLGIANSAARVLPPGTVVFCRDVVVGYVTIMGVEMATSQHFANWICGPDLDPEFLMYALMASREYLQEIASGSVHQTIYMPALESFHIMAPPVEEQKRIAQWLKSALAEADAIREQCDTELKAIEAIPSALLRRVFGDPAN